MSEIKETKKDLICGLAKEDVPCQGCSGTGIWKNATFYAGYHRHREGQEGYEDEPCPDCNGTGDGRPAVLRKIAAAVRYRFPRDCSPQHEADPFIGAETVARWLEKGAEG